MDALCGTADEPLAEDCADVALEETDDTVKAPGVLEGEGRMDQALIQPVTSELTETDREVEGAAMEELAVEEDDEEMFEGPW